MAFVLDNSIVLAWCFEDEASPSTDHVLAALEDDVALVPPIWPLEVSNALCQAERRKRLSAADTMRFTELLRALPIVVEDARLDRATGPVLELARAHQLSCYDASYLELAMREGIPLATLDKSLRTVAERLGVPLMPDT
jgi:predicted nucleic acid-binding protein